MIVVDSSVWIDFFNGRLTSRTAFVRRALTTSSVMIGDLVLTEVLQGFSTQRAADRAHERLALAVPLVISDHGVAALAAQHYRYLRARGITPRKTIDTLIATRCIVDRLPLLYSDRDFDPFAEHLGLRSALDLPGVT